MDGEKTPPEDLDSTQTFEQESGPPQRIGNYRILQKLGEGGMGIVYLAEQEKPIRRRVALKIIKLGMDTKQVVARFEAERQALAMMNHPSVAKVFDAGTTEQGRPYFVMEHVKGIPITEHCDRQKLSMTERLKLFTQACEGVQHAHQKAVIHRDLKPSNVLVAIEGEKAVPKIIDFGVAKATEHRLTEQTVFTQLGQIIGTPEYMSPEQAEMTTQDIDTRSDVYSLGVILYELLVGALPFDPKELRRAGFDEIRRKIREEEPSKPSTRVSSLGEASARSADKRQTDPGSLIRQLRGDLDWITLKALEKDRTRRYGSPSELIADIDHHLQDEPVDASPPKTFYRIGKFARRHRTAVIVSGALCFVLLLGVAGTAFGYIRAVHAERETALEATTYREFRRFMENVLAVESLADLSDPEGMRFRLERATEKTRHETRDRPALKGRLLGAIGVVYRTLGLNAEALPIAEEALDALTIAYGENHPEVARQLISVGVLLIAEGRFEDARSHLERAVIIDELFLGENDRELARTLNLVGNLYITNNRVEEALLFHERSLNIRERAVGVEHPEYAQSLNNIGVLKMRLQDYGGAQDALERALRIREDVLPPDDRELAKTMNNLAEVYLKTGRLELGCSTAERAIALA